ncbi:MAG: carbohydrate ABC transporter permease [Eubacteriales bacterium]|nr:carbohydrate ABC transporter permease [Eubacteriales bacterium]
MKKTWKINLFTVIFLMAILLPFVWLVLASFKNMKELYAYPVQILPSSWSIRNFAEALREQPILQYVKNSFLVSGIATLLIIVICSMTSFSLARTAIKGKKIILLLILTIALLPPVTLLNPIYMMLSNLNMLNSITGLALVMVAVELPSGVWYLMGFFQTIPMELEESAMIDGASVPQIFTKILIPIVSPGVFTISIMTFINVWNNYIFASVLNPTKKARTVTVALTMFSGETYTPWHLIAAAAVFVSIPIIIVVLILQRRIISGMLEGGVKG